MELTQAVPQTDILGKFCPLVLCVCLRVWIKFTLWKYKKKKIIVYFEDTKFESTQSTEATKSFQFSPALKLLKWLKMVMSVKVKFGNMICSSLHFNLTFLLYFEKNVLIHIYG